MQALQASAADCFRSNSRLRFTARGNSGRDIADRPAALNLRRHQPQPVLDASKPLPTRHQWIVGQDVVLLIAMQHRTMSPFHHLTSAYPPL
jgi:hypothetical protein